MNKEEYYKRIEDKMDRQTKLLNDIKDGVHEEFTLIKLAHQKLKYGVMVLTVMILGIAAESYPKIASLMKKLL